MQRLEELSTSEFIKIPNYIRTDRSLSPMSKLLYGEIKCLSYKTGYCFALNNYFSEIYGVSKRTIERAFLELEEHKYIKRDYERNEQKQIVSRKVTVLL